MISFLKKKIIGIDKLKFKKIINVWTTKHMKKGREERTNFSKILPNNHLMPHRASGTRNDYERKINYDWPNYKKETLNGN